MHQVKLCPPVDTQHLPDASREDPGPAERATEGPQAKAPHLRAGHPVWGMGCLIAQRNHVHVALGGQPLDRLHHVGIAALIALQREIRRHDRHV